MWETALQPLLEEEIHLTVFTIEFDLRPSVRKLVNEECASSFYMLSHLSVDRKSAYNDESHFFA